MSKDIHIHTSCYVDKNVSIGDGTKIWHFSHIQRDSKIGNCIIGQNVNIGPGVIIGNNVKIQNNVSVYTGVTIEDDVFIGPSVVFTNVTNPRSFIERKEEFKPTLVKKGSTIGANSTIVCGIEIGEYAFIGAGSVLTQTAPDYVLGYGNPAIIKGWVCKCGCKLSMETSGENENWKCKECGTKYIRYALEPIMKPLETL